MLLDRDCEALHLDSVLAWMVSAVSLISSQFSVRVFLVFSWVGSSLPTTDSISVPLSSCARFPFMVGRESLNNVAVARTEQGSYPASPRLRLSMVSACQFCLHVGA